MREKWSESVPTSPRREVIHVFSSLAKGGAESRTLELIEWMSARATDVHVTVFQVGQPGDMAEKFQDAGAVVITHRFRTPTFWITLTRRLRRRSTLAMHLHVKRGITRPALLLPIAALSGIPTRIVHFRSDGAHPSVSRIARMNERLNYRLIATFATDIIGVSPASLERGWSPAWKKDPRCRVLLSGLSLSPFKGLEPSRRLDGLVGSRPDDTLIVHVGRDTPVKNRERGVKILSALADKRFHLIFIGRSALGSSESLMKLARELGVKGQVHFLGERDDVPQLMADADLTLLTSTHEGLPGVVLESLAAGTPVLATDLPGTQFIANALDDVTLASLTESDTMWAEAVRRVVKSPSRRTRAQIARQLHNSAFDLETAAKQFLTLWTSRKRKGASPQVPARASRLEKDLS